MSWSEKLKMCMKVYFNGWMLTCRVKQYEWSSWRVRALYKCRAYSVETYISVIDVMPGLPALTALLFLRLWILHCIVGYKSRLCPVLASCEISQDIPGILHSAPLIQRVWANFEIIHSTQQSSSLIYTNDSDKSPKCAFPSVWTCLQN